jgi:hypothetical protein
MSAADILKGGQAFLAGQFPATIKVNEQCYQCATSGLKREAFEFEAGPGKVSREISFWLPVSAFAAAGERVPKETSPLYSDFSRAPGDFAQYTINEVMPDGSGATVTLRCKEGAQP